MNFIRRGFGKPLLLVHGLGGSWRSWEPILKALAKHREVIAVDLPGFGSSAPLKGRPSIQTLADTLTQFLKEHNLTGIDAVGTSLGARLVLELARRGDIVGAVVALDPGGFWRGRWERHLFYLKMKASVRLLRLIRPFLPKLVRTGIGRSLLMKPFASYPWRLSEEIAEHELAALADSPSFDEVLKEIAYGEPPRGISAHSVAHPLVIGWGAEDHLFSESGAERAMKLFPDAQFYGFHPCGHFPHLEAPSEVLHLILSATEKANEDAETFKAHGVSIPRRQWAGA